jgi:Flp pilus assembly protein TadB
MGIIEGALIAAAAAAAAGTGYSIYAGEQGAAAQEKAMKNQQEAQKQQQAQARSQQRQSEMAMAAANRRQPDVAGIMAGASEERQAAPQAPC